MRATAVSAPVGAALVFILGFGMMNLLWWLAPSTPQLPGLYDFYSAAWGDGILLPAATAALLVTLSRIRITHDPVPRAFAIGLFGVGTLIGAAVQALWWTDPAPRLNWTLPEPHHFTVAGWYHAVFFAVVCGAFLAMLGVLFHSLARHRESGSSVSEALGGSPLTVLVLAGTGFAALVVRDGMNSPFTTAQLATWSATTGAVLGVFVAIAVLARESMAKVLLRVPAVALWVSAVVAATYLPWHSRIVIFGVVALGVCVALVLGQDGQRLTWTTGSQTVGAAFVCATCISWAIEHRPNNLVVVLVASIAAVGACALFLFSGFDRGVSWVDALAAGVHLLIVAAVGLYLIDAGTVANPLVLTAALAIASFLQVTVTRQLTNHRFQRLISAEDAADKAEAMMAGGSAIAEDVQQARSDVGRVKREVWTWVLGTYGATIVAVLTLTRGAVVSKGFQPGGESGWLSLVVLLVGAGAVCALAGTTAALAKSLPRSERLQPLIFLPAILGVAGWIVLITSAQAFPHRFYYAPWACVAGLLMGFVTWESVLSNVSRLNREKPTPLVHVTAIGLGVLSAVNSYWLLAGVASGPGTPESQLRALGAVLLVFAVQLTVLVSVGYAAQNGLAKLRTRYAPSFNLFQDGILFLAMTFVFGFVPLFVYRHLEPLSIQRSVEVAFALGPTLTFAGGVLVMTLGNNRGHLRRKIVIAEATKDYDGMPIHALCSHIKFQNRMAVALAAITMVGLANAVQDIEDLRDIIFLKR